MPQATNQRLVSQMAVTPTGRGTVYNALLKARAVNRERAGVVNSCERQRLEKVERSIDKDLRHAQWRADQTMNRIKGSLTKLLAYQKVLKEDFPAKQLCSRANFRQNGNNSKLRDTVVPHQRSRGTQNTLAQRRENSQVPSGDTTNEECFHLKSIKEVSAANNIYGSTFRGKAVETTVPDLSERNFDDDSKVSKEKDKVLPSSRDNDDIELDGHGIKHSTKVRPGMDNENTESVIIKPAQPRGDVCGKLLPLRKRLNAHSSVQEGTDESTEMHVHTQREMSSGSEIGKENLTRLKQSGFTRRNERDRQQINKHLSCYHALDTSEESNMRRPLTEAQKVWHTKRIKRKYTTTQRILTKGFDMRTLAWEIDRKLVMMDTTYARQRDRRQLVKEGREDVERLVTRNQAEFPTKVLTSNKQKLKMADTGTCAEVYTGKTSSDGDVTEYAESGTKGQKGVHQENGPVFETVTMLNPLLHKIPLSY